ncbi:TPA: coiled-coil domain-containing protein [Legionella anisa]
MPTIRFRETPLIREILTIYKDLSTKIMDVTHTSIVELPVENQGWGYTFGLTYKEGVIEGLEYPQPGGLSSMARRVQEQNHSKEIKSNCDYFNFVYNTCYQYIADNQNRYFGRANLNDISHGKVIAMILLAHLCRQALEKPVQEQEKYKERIQLFTIELLNHKDIQSTSSQDDKLLSCKSALERIFSASQHEELSSQENKIDAYYQHIEETTRKLNELLVGVDDHMLPLFSMQNQIDVTHLQDLFKKEDKTSLTLTEQRVIHDPFVVELFGRPAASLQEDNYLGLYKGLDYQLPNEGNFLWEQFEQEQRENLIKLLKLRDKLHVLQNELKTLHQFTSANKISYFNDFIKLSEPYLKDIHHVKSELNVCLEKFDADCGKVYRQRSKSSSSARGLWESFYLNKHPLVEVRKHFITASQQISATFASIPFDCFDALKGFSKEAFKVVNRGYTLFGDEFDMASSSFQSDISRAQAKELNRQAELILVKQKSILAEYDELLLQAQESQDETIKKLIDVLQRRRAVVAQMIQALELQNHDVAKEEGFVLIESNDFETKMFEEEHQTIGFFQIISNYLSRPAISTHDYNHLTEELRTLGIELSKAQKENSSLQQLNEENGKALLQKDGEIRTLTNEVQKRDKQLALVASVANASTLDAHNSRLLMQRITNNQTTQVKELLSVVNNMEGIIQQGKNYQKAYETKAGQYDSSLFFSHNDNGKKHARKIMSTWERYLCSMMNEAITQALEKGEHMDEAIILELTQSLSGTLVDSIDNLIINEDYSSYKEHSFRNYLRYFHQQLITDDGQLNVSLIAKRNPIKDVDAIFVTANSSFDKTQLEKFEQSIKDYKSFSI